MLEASTTGRAQHRNKTINAEVNLLSEWQRKRTSLSEQITRATIAIALISLLTFGVTPFLMRAFFDADRRLTKARFAVKDSNAQLVVAEQKKTGAIPKLDQGAMQDIVIREANQFLGHTVAVMNAAEAGMAIESINVNVISGELTINCKADAESNTVAEEFMNRAKIGPNVRSSLLVNTQVNDKLAPGGVGFEFSKSVEVSP